MDDLVYPKTSYKITGLLFRVHNELGKMRNERQYADAVEQCLKQGGMSYEREKEIPVSFDGEHSRRNIADFVIDKKIILEIKSKRFVTREDYYQVRRYLEAMQLKLGIIVNFRDRYLRPKRVLNSSVKDSQFAD